MNLDQVQHKAWHTTWLEMNFQLSLARESQVSRFLGQVYQGGTSGFWGSECLEFESIDALLK